MCLYKNGSDLFHIMQWFSYCKREQQHKVFFDSVVISVYLSLRIYQLLIDICSIIIFNDVFVLDFPF